MPDALTLDTWRSAGDIAKRIVDHSWLRSPLHGPRYDAVAGTGLINTGRGCVPWTLPGIEGGSVDVERFPAGYALSAWADGDPDGWGIGTDGCASISVDAQGIAVSEGQILERRPARREAA